MSLVVLIVACEGPSQIPVGGKESAVSSDVLTTELGQEETPTVGASVDGCWSQFRGPDGSGHAPEAKVPTKWSNTENLKWKTRLFGRGASMPVIWRDRVFITAYSGYGLQAGNAGNKSALRLHVICLDRKTGAQVWQRTVRGSSAAQKPSENYLRHGSASSTPYCDGERIYVSFGVSGLYAFDLAGTLLWQADVGALSDNFGSSASPMVYQDLLIINASIENKRLLAFDKRTGEGRWVYDGPGQEGVDRTWSMPVLGKSSEGRDELVFNQNHRISGIDPLTGTELWHCKGIQDYVISHPLVQDDIAWCSGGKQSRLIAVRLGGNGDVTNTHRLWDSPVVANVPSPILYDGKIYVVGENSILQQFDMKSGKLGFKRRVKCSGRVFSSMVKTKDYFYVSAPGNGIAVIDPSKDFKVVSANLLDKDASDTLSCCAIADDQLFYRNDEWVYCVGETDSETDSESLQQQVQADESLGVIQPRRQFEIDEHGNQKQYSRLLMKNRADFSALVLNPYKSIIELGEEKRALLAIVDSFWEQHRQIREDLSKLLVLQNQISAQEYLGRFAKIEARTLKLDATIRANVKEQFSEDQMTQHRAEHAAWLEAQKAKKQ